MNLPLILGSFVLVTACVAVVSWWRTRVLNNRDARSYFLADHRLPWLQVAGSMLLTNLSTEQLVGLNGAASLHGAVVMAWEIVPVFALIAMAWYFLPRYWSGNITTIPEFLEQRFDRPTRWLMSVMFILTIALNSLPFVLYSGAVAMSSIFHLDELLQVSRGQACGLVACAIGGICCCYVVLGGMKAVALSDTLYGAGLIAAGLLVPVFALFRLGQGDFGVGLARVLDHQAAKLNPIGTESSNVPFSTLFTGMLLINVFYWCTNQVIVQRSFGASSFAEAQKGILATAALKLLGPFFLVFPGIIAVEMFGSGVGNGDDAYAQLVAAVLPASCIGVFAAVLVGSIISAFNGGLHSACTLFSVDLYRPWFRSNASDAEIVRAGKVFAAVVCVVAVLVSASLGDSNEGVFTFMKRIMASFKLPLLAVVLMGVSTRRIPAWAAKAALVAGVASFFLLDAMLGHGRFGVALHWLHIAALNTVLICAFMAAAGWVSPRSETVRSRDSVAASHPAALSPWPGVRIASIAVAVLALTFNFGLWWFAHSRKA